jgi:hypothetical protein
VSFNEKKVVLPKCPALSYIFIVHFPSWGAKDPNERGPVVATNRSDDVRNAIGAHGGSYCVYRALAVATGKLDLVSFLFVVVAVTGKAMPFTICFVAAKGPLPEIEVDCAPFQDWT